jgi:tetratricopeptide (TPR) repeat protein
MRNSNNPIKTALVFCVIPLLMAISSCAIQDTNTVNIHSWTKDVDTLANRKAAAKFWSGIREHSNMVDAHKRLGGFYQQQGKHREAVAEFCKAIKAKTDDARVYNSLAISYDALKEYTFAEMAYKDAIALAPEQSYLYNNYGCSSMLRGDRAAAVTLFKKAASLDSKSRRIKNNLSMASYGVDKQETTIAPVPAVPDTSKETTPIATANSADEGNWFTALIDSALTFLGFAGDDKSVDENIVSVGDTIKMQEKLGKESKVGTVIHVHPLQLPGYLESDLSIESQQITEAIEPPLYKPVSMKRKFPLFTGNEQVAQSNRKVAIEVSNGSNVKDIATKTAAYFRDQGQYIHSITDAKHFDFKKSIVFYRKGYLPDAYKIALMVPGYQEMKQVGSLGRPEVSVKLLLGQDMAILHFPEIMAGFSPEQIPNYDQTVTMVDW